jgi:hypothetical protein
VPRISISYRREDSAAITRRIYDRLCDHYGRDSVFRDIDAIPAGADFRQYINAMLAQTDITLVVVGPRWFGERRGRRRIDDPADPVRVLVETALRNGIPVVPVLVDGVGMPGADQLPESLRDLVWRNGLQVDSGRDFDQHVERLIRSMEPISADAAQRTEEQSQRAEAERRAREERFNEGGSRGYPGLSISELLEARIEARGRTAHLRREFGDFLETAMRAEGERQPGKAASPLPAARAAYGRRGWSIALIIWPLVALGLAAAAALALAIVRFFQAKTSWLPDHQEVTTAIAIAVAPPMAPSAEQQPQLDLVDVSAFAPEGGNAGSEVLVQVLLHRLDNAAIAEELARAADPDAIRRGIATLIAEIARGKRVDILIEGRGATIDEPVQSVVWRGEACGAQFIVTLPEATTDSGCNLRVRVLLEEVPIGSLRFALKVSVARPIDPKNIVIRGDTASRYRRAFLSYTTPDRPEVLKRAQALRAARIDFFQDFLSIDPGQRWERRLYEEIERCDLFLLFWSKSAAQSEWVLREAELAVTRQNTSPNEEPDITPIILEGPPVPEPIPDSLKHLQFNDHLLYFISTAERDR